MVFVNVVVPSTGTSTAPKDTPCRLGSVLLYATTFAAAALPTSTRPAPTRPTPYRVPPPTVVARSCVAVLQANATSSCTLHVGCSCLSNDITPATCGVAEDVPLKFSTALPLVLLIGV